MTDTNNINILEALLFSCGEPVEIERIADVMELDESVIIALAEALGEKYEQNKYNCPQENPIYSILFKMQKQ